MIKSSASFVLEPPHPLDFRMSNMALFHDAWTQQARQQVLSGVEKEISDLNLQILRLIPNVFSPRYKIS